MITKIAKKHGNVTCPAWQHFGFFVARNESIGVVDLFETKRTHVVNTSESAPASASETESASASVAYRNRGLLEGKRIVDKTSYRCGLVLICLYCPRDGHSHLGLANCNKRLGLISGYIFKRLGLAN